MIQSRNDIFEELSFTPAQDDDYGTARPELIWKNLDLTDEQKSICMALSTGKVHIDKLSEQVDQPGFKLLPMMLELEMLGTVKQTAGKYFELI